MNISDKEVGDTDEVLGKELCLYLMHPKVLQMWVELDFELVNNVKEDYLDQCTILQLYTASVDVFYGVIRKDASRHENDQDGRHPKI